MAKIDLHSPVSPQTSKLILDGLDDGLKLKIAQLFNNYIVAEDTSAAHDRLANDLAYTVEYYEEIKAELQVILTPQVAAGKPGPR